MDEKKGGERWRHDRNYSSYNFKGAFLLSLFSRKVADSIRDEVI
jgi:hypothetical protein